MRWFASLRRPGEIAHVRRSGRRYSADTMTAYLMFARPQSAGSLVAVTVSKSVGGAVTRNRVKRRIKGALDALPAPAAPMRLVIVARPVAAAGPYARLAQDVAAVLAPRSPGP